MRSLRRTTVLVTAALLGCGGGHPTPNGTGETPAPNGHDAGPAVAPGQPDAGEPVQDAGIEDVTEEPVGVLDAGACPALAATGQWKNVTPPGAASAGTDAIAVRPDYPSTIYAGSNGNGIFRSTDCGATWSLISTGAHAKDLASGNPWSMAIDPVEPDTMYVVEGYGSSGLWKSTNGGVDWTNVLTDPAITSAFYASGFITGVDIDPTDHTHLVIESHGNCASGHLCAAESSDAGGTWKLIDMATVGAWSENSSIAMLDRKTWLYGGLFSGFYRTSDEGATWSAVDVMGALPSCNYYDPFVWQASDGRYYVPAIAYAGPGLLRSAPNDSSTWTLVPNSPQATALVPTATHLVMAKMSGEAFYIASQSDPTTWTDFPSPMGTTGTGTGAFLAYDKVHHVLYATNWNKLADDSGAPAGLWQIVTD